MIRSFLSVAADRVIVDSRNNRLSIIDVQEGIKSQSFPLVIHSITFLFYLRRDEDDPTNKNVSLKCSVNDTETLVVPVEIDFKQGYVTRVIITFEGFIIPNAGILKATLIDGELELGVFEIPVEMLDIPNPEANVDTAPPSS